MINECGTDRYYDVSDIPGSQTEQARIGTINAIYAAGDFVTNDNGELVWDPDMPVRRLYWQEDGLWNEITVSGESATRHDKEALIAYAESLR